MRTGCVFVAAMWAFSAPAQAATLHCAVTQKFHCVAGEGCLPAPLTVWNRIDPNRKTYARCGATGCDTYPATFTRSGVFTGIELHGRGVTVKLGDDLSFLEIVTLGTDAYVSHGSCEIIPGP